MAAKPIAFDPATLRLQCFECGRWYDAPDISSMDLSCYIPFMCNYEFTAPCCGEPVIAKKTASFIQIAITAIANLTAMDKGDKKVYYSIDGEIIPFIEKHWDLLCTHRSKSAAWKQKLFAKLTSEGRIFCCCDDTTCTHFGLIDQDLSTVGPKRYQSKPVPAKVLGKSKAGEGGIDVPPAKKGKPISELVLTKLLSHEYPIDHPYNKDGFQYIYSEQDPHAAMDFDPEELAGKPIPSELYRPAIHDKVLLSLNDRAPQLKIGEDRLAMTGDKGYSMIRANHGVRSGTWYYEVDVTDMSQPDCAIRLGWAQKHGNVQAPCGFDKFSYSWRSKKGTAFHNSRGKHFSDEGFTTGDNVGVLIHLPTTKQTDNALPITHKGEALIKFKNFFYFEHKETPVAEAEQHLQVCNGSEISFFKNGVCMGTAFRDINGGIYYPAISTYKNAMVTANFGPDFKHFPDVDGVKPICASGIECSVKQTMAELLYHVTHKLVSVPDT